MRNISSNLVHSHLQNFFGSVIDEKLKQVFSVIIIATNNNSLSTIAQIELEAVSTYNSGLIDESATEIVTYDLKTQRVFVLNASGGNVDVLDISNQSVLTLMFTIEVSMDGGAANCFAFHNGLLAITVADKNGRDLGPVQVR